MLRSKLNIGITAQYRNHRSLQGTQLNTGITAQYRNHSSIQGSQLNTGIINHSRDTDQFNKKEEHKSRNYGSLTKI